MTFIFKIYDIMSTHWLPKSTGILFELEAEYNNLLKFNNYDYNHKARFQAFKRSF